MVRNFAVYIQGLLKDSADGINHWAYRGDFVGIFLMI
jgi:hypothetical protein